MPTHTEILERGILEPTYGFFDRHLHLRKNEMMRLVLPFSAKQACGGIIMPNIDPHITTWDLAFQYRAQIDQELRAIKESIDFIPHLTCYLTDSTDPNNLEEGWNNGAWRAAKLYFVGSTTNSGGGVTKIENIYNCLERMEKIGMPLLIHGEFVHDTLDPLDFEARFISDILFSEILERFPELKVVLEHITTSESAALVVMGNYNLWATVAPQYLLFSHRHLFQSGSVSQGTFRRGIRPKFWCMPILKRESHRKDLLNAVCSGSDRFGAGTDSAPHANHKKYADFGCGGCFTGKTALEMYAAAFEEGEALDKLSNFLGKNLIKEVYGLRFPKPGELRNQPTLIRSNQKVPKAETFDNGDVHIDVDNLMGEAELAWTAVITSE